MLYRKGEVAFACGMLIIAGHVLIFLTIWSNSSISPTSKSDIISIIVPLTVASVTSAVLYAVKHAEINFKSTPIVNPFFLFVAIFIPLIFFGIIIWQLYGLDGQDSVDDFKLFIVAFEAMFGGLLIVVTEALFSSAKAKKN